MSNIQNERKVPVFTVWKNNRIIKNIFLINTPTNSFVDFRHFEERLLVGRHPDCDIRVEHPSISRFHLTFHSLPCFNLLFVTDLSSVHGTWLSGQRIAPNIRIKVKDGDELRIGESNRVYKLHWIPFSQAYDVYNPFVPPLDFPNLQEDKDEIMMDKNSVELEDEEVQIVDDISDDLSKGLESLDLCNDDEIVAEKLVPEALSLQPRNSIAVKDEAYESADSDVDEGVEKDLENEGLVSLFMSESVDWTEQPEVGSLPSLKDEDSEFASSILEGLDELLLDENSELLSQEDTLSVPSMLEDTEFSTPQNLDKKRPEFQSEVLGYEKQIPQQEEDVQDNARSFSYESIFTPSRPTVEGLFDTEFENQPEKTESPEFCDKECLVSTIVNTELWSFWSGKMGVESVRSALSDAETFSESENKSLISGYLNSPHSSRKEQITSPSITSEQKSARSILSREGICSLSESPKHVSSVKEIFESPLSDWNPMDTIWSRGGKMVSAPQVHEEAFTADKENFTPSSHKSTRKFAAVLKEIQNLSSGKSPLRKTICKPGNYCDDNISPKNLLKQHTMRYASGLVQSARRKEIKEGRVTIQQSLLGSPQKSVSECYLTDVAKNGVTFKEKCIIKEGMQQWKMVVDASTLLNKESRKALQLLEGLKGTRLIIPKTVITELASLKQQAGFFRRNTEAFSALKWIQDCTVKTKWWIHVQNSTEEDDALDYALNFRKNNTEGQLIFLSNDISVKIKAISEGMISETAEEFRKSLVNPFSERFRWSDSCPRGRTWSYADDIFLKEKFYPSSLKMTSKAMENVKGLKLILRHNSEYYGSITAIH